MLKDTGERLIINDKWDQKTITEHKHRYYMAGTAITAQDVVLDAACGTGYGSHMLAQRAKKVVGIDISADAVEYAEQHYRADNLEYIQMSIEKLDFPDHYFDTIVSFETIEHVEPQLQLRFLEEIKRCLKPEGRLIISTPDDALLRRMTHGQYENEYHVAEFTEEEFTAFLEARFQYVRLYYQNIADVSCILQKGKQAEAIRAISDDPVNEMGRYYIAVCSDEEPVTFPENSAMIPNIRRYYQETYLDGKATLYPDCGNGYSGEWSVTARNESGDEKTFRYCFDVRDFEDIRRLRFDPCETSCKVRLLHVRSNLREHMFIPLNSSSREGDWEVFLHPDPMYEEAGDLSGLTHIEFEGEMEGIPARTAFDTLTEQVCETTTKNRHLDETLTATRVVLQDTAAVRDGYKAELEATRAVRDGYKEELDATRIVLEDTVTVRDGYKEELDATRVVLQDTVAVRDGYKAELDRVCRELDENREKAERLREELGRQESLAEELKKSNAEISSALDAAGNELMQLSARRDQLAQESEYLRRMYESISASTFWKMTWPLRRGADLAKGVIRKFPGLLRLCKGLRFLLRHGFAETLREIERRKQAAQPVKELAFTPDGIVWESITPLRELDKRIAVQLHLYYEDLADEFCAYLNHVPFRFDLYISCRDTANAAKIKSRFRKIRHVNKVLVRPAQNRGRDIAPVYVLFREELAAYDYIAHIHSKKSLYSGQERRGWRQYAMDCLFGSAETVGKIFALFESDQGIGVLAPETYGDLPMIANTWLSNEGIGRELLAKMDITFQGGYFNYPVGSFFWAKREALQPLFDLKLTNEDFPEEKGQMDGTLAHALERAVAFVAQHQGYQLSFYDQDEGLVRVGRSDKYLRPYFSLTPEAVQYHLGQYDLITFDVFDTLITRKVLNPDDAFKLMGLRAGEKFGLYVDYLACRKRAEALAWDKVGASCSITDIYREMETVLGISADMARKLMELEIETELELAVPRKDMLRVFEHLLREEKRIILISDMYLPGEVIQRMLKKCGYHGWEALWVSCDRGVRKDCDTMWVQFFEQYGDLRTVHVGDHPRSDAQLLLDRHRDYFPVLSSRALYTLSDIHRDLSKYETGSVENSLVLGMVINEGLFNSPFAMKADGHVKVPPEELAFAWFGPIFSEFAAWLASREFNDIGILFLAREGFLLQQIYAEFCRNRGLKERPNEYFLTSRRAATVAGIRTEADLRATINQYYHGDLKNLLAARLGIETDGESGREMIQMPRDEERVLAFLHTKKELLQTAIPEERENYLQYIREVEQRLGTDKLAVVDVGYSGTIQYYLSRLLERPVDGYYLSTGVNRKPLQLGCICESIYPVNTVEETLTSKIFKSQLFLEAILQAPYGQLIRFVRRGDAVEPEFRNDSDVPAIVRTMQQGLRRFVGEYAAITKDLPPAFVIDKDLAEELLADVPGRKCMSRTVCEAFSVQDDYCSNGTQRFDPTEGRWVIK